MTGRCRALRVVLPMALTAFPPPADPAPPTISAELARCGAIRAADERLACYDTLVCAAISAADERLACYDALAKTKASNTDPAPAGAVGAETSGGHDQSFGLVRKPPAKPLGPELIKAVVAQISMDRFGNASVALDNGQSWTFNDPDTRLSAGDAVTIRRAALGSFLMTTLSPHLPRTAHAVVMRPPPL
jgi:hypothetical protein